MFHHASSYLTISQTTQLNSVLWLSFFCNLLRKMKMLGKRPAEPNRTESSIFIVVLLMVYYITFD